MSEPVLPDRCSLRADLRDDPMIGTAFPASRLLLVEQAGPWGRTSLRDTRLPAEVSEQLLARAAERGLRVQTIRRLGAWAAPGPRRWALVDTAVEGAGIVWGRFDDPAELVDLSLDVDASRDGSADDGVPVYLVCTHGKHDPCCAVRGRPVAAALQLARPGQVWETSHVGGDRFSANVLVLPSGVLYGRVTPDAVPELVRAVEADDVLLALLRGQVGMAPVAQAALAFAYRHAGTSRRQDLQVGRVSPVRAGRATVDVHGPTGALRLVVRIDTVPAEGLTCAAPGAGHYQRYSIAAVETIPD